jgi:hypothetical protein
MVKDDHVVDEVEGGESREKIKLTEEPLDEIDIEFMMRFSPHQDFTHNEGSLAVDIAWNPGLTAEELFGLITKEGHYTSENPPTWTMEKLDLALETLEKKGFIKAKKSLQGKCYYIF